MAQRRFRRRLVPGKTVFAALVFEQLRDLDLVDRMVVLAPRRTLVEQWATALAATRHIELRPFHELERSSRQGGVVVTYQSLNPDTLYNHRTQADRMRTLLVLDEVHHVGEPAPQDGAWRDAFVGAVLDRLEQAWRSLEKQVPVKALIVAARQADARAFQETANRLMRERGLTTVPRSPSSVSPQTSSLRSTSVRSSPALSASRGTRTSRGGRSLLPSCFQMPSSWFR